MKTVPLAIPIPKTFQGRPVTHWGVHGPPWGQWGFFMGEIDTWIRRLHETHITWILALSDDDSFVKQGAAKALLDGGILPIVRFNPSNLPRPFTQMDATSELVDLYAKYNVPCIICYLNECGAPEEWKDREVPKDWWEIWTERWRGGARLITERGAIAAIPDGPTWPMSPFPFLLPGLEREFEEGWIVYKYHGYTNNRPPPYPYDDVQRLGIQMTLAEYNAGLDDFADVADWRDPPLPILNAARREYANANLTAIDDPTCWMGWQKIEYWMDRDLGFRIPMFMGEGGTTPKARAGSGHNNELRYLLPTPIRVGDWTSEIYHWNQLPNRPAKHNLFALTAWLGMRAGFPGWGSDPWWGSDYSVFYGYEMPVVQVLRDNPPQSNATEKLEEAVYHLLKSQTATAAAQVRLDRAKEALG